MRLNNINSNMYTLSSVGLDKEQRTISIHDSGEPGNSLQSTGNANEEIECQPLDIFCQKNSLRNIRFIKADVEGMGTDVLLGAQQTIRKERPVLSLSIYHNKEELLGVFKILTSWNLNYKIKIRMMNFPLHADELTLVAWPIEIE